MRNKTLVFMYIAESHGFHEQKFNFSTKEKLDVSKNSEGNLFLSRQKYDCGIPDSFWGKNILEMNLFVGENGAGKTTVMRLICQWICYLSVKKFPSETGILVFKEDDDLKYVAFSGRKEMMIYTDIPNICMHEIIDFFNDIQLVYCSNTMTELKIDGYDILRDYSIPSKIKTANANRHAIGEDIMANYKSYEFKRQIDVALSNMKFPIEYISLEIRKYSSDEISSLLLNRKKDILKELNELAEIELENNNENMVLESELKEIKFLHALFMGLLIKLLKWGKRHEHNGRNYVEDALNKLFRSSVILNENDFINKNGRNIKDFLKEMFNCCESSYNESVFSNDYNMYWSKVREYVNYVIDLVSNDTKNIYFSFWMIEPATMKIGKKESVWKMKLKKNKVNFNRFWEVYSQIDYLIENIYFSWEASSGEQSWVGLFSDLNNDRLYSNKKNIWYLLDEPDNTFHPEWKRKLIKKILKVLNRSSSKKQIWISTHSPIMLSDVPGQAATYLKKGHKGEKVIDEEEKRTFGQNIYVLFDDAFFLKEGVIGKFASSKIVNAVRGLEKIEKFLLKNKHGTQLSSEQLEEIRRRIEYYDKITRMVAEPLFREQMEYYAKNCKKMIGQVRKSD